MVFNKRLQLHVFGHMEESGAVFQLWRFVHSFEKQPHVLSEINVLDIEVEQHASDDIWNYEDGVDEEFLVHFSSICTVDMENFTKAQALEQSN